jgi:chitin disaccharide deacetylase
MSDERILIVNADDFGQSAGINAGIVEAHRRGIVTSASLMVRGSAAAEAVELGRDCPALSLGLHLDLGEWVFRDSAWVPRYQVVPLDDPQAVRAEMARQLASFQRMTRSEPTHIDSHQHVHLNEPVRAIAEEFAQALRVPLRRCHAAIRYCGDFYGQDSDGSPLPARISVDGLLGILADLPEGVVELCCHPAAAADLDTMYRAERRQELAALCDPRIRGAVEKLGIKLCSFRDIAS